MTEIPAVVKEVSRSRSRKQAIIENLQRSNLNPIEEAKAYRSLINELAYSHEELAKLWGNPGPISVTLSDSSNFPKRYRQVSKWQTESRTC